MINSSHFRAAGHQNGDGTNNGNFLFLEDRTPETASAAKRDGEAFLNRLYPVDRPLPIRENARGPSSISVFSVLLLLILLLLLLLLLLLFIYFLFNFHRIYGAFSVRFCGLRVKGTWCYCSRQKTTRRAPLTGRAK